MSHAARIERPEAARYSLRVIVGVLSDSHGQAARTGAAVALLRRLNAEALLHCGDVGSVDVLEQLAVMPAWFVFGNTDANPGELAQAARRLGLPIPTSVPVRIELSGRVLLLCHGHEAAFEWVLRAAQAKEGNQPGGEAEELLRDAHYVLYGHTHVAAAQQIGRVNFVNPGALQRARVYTVATIDLTHDVVEHWVVDEASRADAPPKRFAV